MAVLAVVLVSTGADRHDLMTKDVFPVNKEAPAALADIESGVWQNLCNAVDDSMAAWRLPCLATQSCNG
jgi:hypothetical protein